MSENGQYIRIRGKVTGPFDVAGLQKLVRRGALSRMHEVSQDRVNWAPAGEFEELFPAAPATVVVRNELNTDKQPIQVTTSAMPTMHESYFYVQNGATVGPVPLNVLQSLAQNGTLASNDLCWPEGAQLASSAGQLPALAPIYSGQQAASLGRRGAHPSRIGTPFAETAISAVARWSQTLGVIIAVLLLLVLNLPIGTYRDRTIWWWSAIFEPGNATVTLVLFFVFLSALIIGPIAVLGSGLLRAWFFVGIASLSLVLFLALGLNFSMEASYFFGLVIPYAAAALIGVSGFRTKMPTARMGALFQGILGGLLIFSLLVLIVLAVVRNTSVTGPGFSSEHLPGWIVAVLTIGIIDGFAGLGAGVLGLVGLRQNLSGGVNAATIICCCASIVLPLLAVVIAVAGSADFLFGGQNASVLFLVIRICAGFVGYLMLMGTGIAELFTSYAIST